MANNLTAIITADTSKFVEEVRSAQHMLDKFVKESKNASKELGKSSPVTNEQITAYQRVISVLDKVASGTMNTKQQQAALAESVKELKVQWSSLSDAAKSSSFGQSLSDASRMAQEQLKALATQVKIANEDVSKLGNAAPNGTLKKELRLTQNQLEKLTQQYRLMSAAEQQSASGRELASKMDELREKAGVLRDTIGDVNQEINVKASDTPNLDAFNAALGIGADALSTYSSIIAKVTGNEKALQDAIATVMTVQSAANLATKVANALQSSSVIMLKTRAIQEGAAAIAIKLKTAAEAKGVVATKAATVAQAAFNAVAKANPYVLLASAVIAAGSALLMFSKNANNAADEQDQLNNELDEGQKAAERYKQTAADTYANLMTSYQKLKSEWNSLKNEHEKNAWIEENKSKFNELGISVTDVVSAEGVFNGNTDAVVQAFIARAKAAARLAEMTEEYRKQMKLIDEISEIETTIKTDAQRSGRTAKRGDVIKDPSYHNSRYGNVNQQGIWTFHEQGAKLYSGTDVSSNPQLKAKQAELDASIAKTNRLATEAAADAKVVKVKGKQNRTSGKNDKPNRVEETPLAGSLEALKKEQSKIQEQLTKGKIKPDDIYDKETNQTVAQRLQELPKIISDKEIELGLKVDPEIKNKEEAANKLKDNLEALAKEYDDISFSPSISSFDIATGKGNFSKKTLEGIQNLMNYNDGLISQLNNLKKKYEKYGDTTSEEYQKVVNKIVALKGEQDKLGEQAKSLSKKSFAEKFNAGVEKYNKISQPMMSVDGVVNSMDTLIDKIEEGANAWDIFVGALNVVDGVLSTIQDTIEAVTAVQEVLGLTTETTTAISTAATQQETANTAQEVANSSTKIAAKTGEGVANATASGAKMPFPLNLVAIAAGVAAVFAAIAKIGSFANGGIIQGATTIGDYNLARVNSGEMILNGKQQNNLFRAIDENRLGSGGAAIVGGEIRIKGQDLYVALKNYSKVQNKLGKNTGIL